MASVSTPSELIAPRAAGAGAREPGAIVAALVVAAFLVAFGALHYGFFQRNLLMDTPLYQRYGEAMVHEHRVPYRDFAVEYPPGALPAFAAPALVSEPGDFAGYARWFEVLMLLCGAAAAAIVGVVLVRQRAPLPRLLVSTLIAGLAPLALGPVILSRYDLLPAALTVAALAGVVMGRPRLGFAVLGAAVAAKVYPAVLLPLLAVYVWRRAGRRELAICSGVFAGVVAAALVPFAVLAPGGVWHSLTQQAGRPLQIETLGAAALLAAHHTLGFGLTQVSSYGSDNLVGRLPDALATAQSLLVAGTVVGLWIAFARGDADRDRLLRYAAAAVCAFVALGKVLSPQYLVWLVALVVLVRGRRGAAGAALLLAAMVLTQFWFPYRYIELVYELDPRASWLVLARNLVLVALLVTLVWPDRRLPRTGSTVVAVVGAAAVAAIGAAATSSAAASGPTHQGLLQATGIPSTCAAPRPAPAASAGLARYDTASFPVGGASCVSVTITAGPRVQLFAAAYGDRFDPADPRARYLGDAGTCTNVAGAVGRVARFSVAPSGRERVVVEVEGCGATNDVVPYAIHVAAGSGTRVRIAAARAVRTGEDVVISWRGAEPPGTRFLVYREQRGRTHPFAAGRSTVRDRGGASRPATRYWIKASTRGGWAWYGPLVP